MSGVPGGTTTTSETVRSAFMDQAEPWVSCTTASSASLASSAYESATNTKEKDTTSPSSLSASAGRGEQETCVLSPPPLQQLQSHNVNTTVSVVDVAEGTGEVPDSTSMSDEQFAEFLANQEKEEMDRLQAEKRRQEEEDERMAQELAASLSTAPRKAPVGESPTEHDEAEHTQTHQLLVSHDEELARQLQSEFNTDSVEAPPDLRNIPVRLRFPSNFDPEKIRLMEALFSMHAPRLVPSVDFRTDVTPFPPILSRVPEEHSEIPSSPVSTRLSSRRLQAALSGNSESSYEDLLQLGEMIGPAVPRGATAEVIDTLPIHKFESSVTENDKCGICLEDYEKGTLLRILPNCHHSFHKTCIDKWLSINKVCPVCRESILS
ncbi:E3 ubiquitin-protein ligase RNF38/44 [Pelomyxa schiedti]|nr:E3 ubiquitin-protein ligase RNF38/44 [Pelomyxa schiedti]